MNLVEFRLALAQCFAGLGARLRQLLQARTSHDIIVDRCSMWYHAIIVLNITHVYLCDALKLQLGVVKAFATRRQLLLFQMMLRRHQACILLMSCITMNKLRSSICNHAQCDVTRRTCLLLSSAKRNLRRVSASRMTSLSPASPAW